MSDNRYLSTLLALESQLDKLYVDKDHEFTEDDDVRFRAVLSDLADRELVITISWAKQVPGKEGLLGSGVAVVVVSVVVVCGWVDGTACV